VGTFESKEELTREWRADREFLPQMEDAAREKLLGGWRRAVQRNLRWAESEE